MACSLRSPNEVCEVFEDISAEAMNAWTLYLVNDVVVINKAAAALGDTVVQYYFIPKVIVDCVAVTSGNLAAYDVGQTVYYDAATHSVTTVANAYVCGFVTVAPAIGDTTVEIHFDGTLRIVA